MKKFIVCGDSHYKGINPRAWIGDYPKAILRQFREVFSLVAKHQAHGIIIAGDLFDSPQTMLGTIAELGALFQEAPCRILTVPGNHDLWGANVSSKPRTPYGFLGRLGLTWDLTEQPYEMKGDSGVCITGRSYTVETDTPAGAGQFCPEPRLDWKGTSIHVVHSMLLLTPPPFEMRHTLVSQVETAANVIISGHDHTGFGVYRRDDGVLFINPGALCRLTAKEIDRQVQVALLTVDGKGNAEAQLIPLESAQPGHEVLSREHLESEAERAARMEEFLGLLASEGEAKFLEVRDIIEDIAARENLPADVKLDALRRIGEAREQLALIQA